MMQKGMTRRTFAKAATAAALGLTIDGTSQAQQGYPSRPVRFVLPFAAGGVADITSRLAAERLGSKLGQQFVIENTPGPGGIAAARAVLTAVPDGYTLGLVTNGTAISVALYNSLPFDPVKDFAMISNLGSFELVFATNVGSPYRTLPDFIKAAKDRPGKLNIGTIAVGSTQNLAAELFKSMAGLNLTIVPYRATPDVLVGLLRNDIHLMIDFYTAMKGSLSDKKIRAVATSGLKRTAYLPDVPTASEAGVPGYEATSWNGVFARQGTSQDIINLLNRSMREVLEVPEVKARYLELGVEASASSPEELMQRLKADIAKWGKVIEQAKIPKL
jgi:tripartite-type tricarboxylate transporter receptor subunit TctC